MNKLVTLVLLSFFLLPIAVRADWIGAADASPCVGLADDVKTLCETCMGSDKNTTTGKVWTAAGCLNTGSSKSLVSELLGWAVVIGGGVAFLIMVAAGFQMTMAAGDPKKVQAARELLISAISGLVLIVLSIVLLNFLGVGVLGLDIIGFKV